MGSTGGGRPNISRRGFLLGGAAMSGGWALEKSLVNALAPASAINFGAIAHSDAVRVGNMYQETPLMPPPKQNWYAGEMITHVLTEAPHYGGTIDDGPSPFNTDSILFAADDHKVKLTFFVIGIMVQAYPEILRRIHDAGHQIGGHSKYHTPYTAVGLAPQIAMCQEIIHNEIAEYPTAVRAPGLTQGAIYLQAARQANVCEVQTNWITTDYLSPRILADAILQEHIRGLKRGGIEINHDGGTKRPTSDAYDSMLDYSAEMRISSVRMDELMNGGIPASGFYAPVNSFKASSFGTGSGLAVQYVDRCNFDVFSSLKRDLRSGKLRRAQRSRVLEALAEMEQLREAL